MSTNEQQLPKTWEEYQRERRKAFLDGIFYAEAQTSDGDEEEARSRYPIKKRVPRTTTCDYRTFSLSGGLLRIESKLGDQDGGLLCSKCVAAMADLFANPYTEVEE